MSEEIEEQGKKPHKIDAGDVIAWLVIAWFGICLVWALTDTFLLGSLQGALDMVAHEGGDVSPRDGLMLLGYCFVDFAIKAGGALICFVIMQMHVEGGLTSAATILLCIVALFVVGLATQLWHYLGGRLLLSMVEGSDTIWDVILQLACIGVSATALLAPFRFIWDRFVDRQ